MAFAADEEISRIGVFLAASAALISSSFLAVLLGFGVSRHIPAHYIKAGAGITFIVIGIWFLWSVLKG